MSEIVNLRRVRKAKARADREAEAARNRVAFGRSAAERRQAEAQASLEARRVDGHRIGTARDDDRDHGD